MGRKLWAVTVLLLAMVARVFYPQVRMVVQDFLASPSSPSPHIEFPESILSNRPLERLGDLLAPIIKAVLKLAAPHQPLAGSRSIKGLKAAVDISYDDFGVPHIYAQDMRDLYFAQGYVTAHDRMFEMHFHRFLVHGRVAEIVGEVAVESDMLLRMHAFGKMGAAAAKKISPGFLPRLQAYVDGVNAYLNSEDYQAPVEFSIMGLEKPHPWGLDDVLGLVMFQAWQMSEGWNLEIARANIQEHLNVSVTDKIFADIDSIYHPNHPTLVPKGTSFSSENADKMAAGLHQKRGSNFWVIAGEHTASGKPLVCSDPHLPLMVPSFWYEVHLECEEDNYRAFGPSVAGAPGVLLGHTQFMAWGITLSFVDGEDLVVERSNATHYEFKGQWLPFRLQREQFKVKEGHIVERNLRFSRNGPLISDALKLGKSIALRSSLATMDLATTSEAFLTLSNSHNIDEFIARVKKIDIPLTFGFADIHGNIGFRSSSTVPIRSQKGYTGKNAVEGWSGEYEWVDRCKPDDMPSLINPAKGFVHSSNHKLVPDDYPVWLGDIFLPGYRAERIDRVLRAQIAEKKKFTIKDGQKLQVDVTSVAAQDFVTEVKRFDKEVSALLTTDNEKAAWKILTEFSGTMATDAVGPSIYATARFFTMRHLLVPVLGEKVATDLMGAGAHPELANPNEIGGYDILVLLSVLRKGDSWWLNKTGGSAVVISNGLKSAVAYLTRELGTDVRQWKYGLIHQVVFEHPFEAVPVLSRVFSVGPLPLPGDSDTPMLAGIIAAKPFNVGGWCTHWRMCIDMADVSTAQSIHAPGQVGAIGSEHYDNMMPLWLAGSGRTMYWEKQTVKEHEKSKLTFAPQA